MSVCGTCGEPNSERARFCQACGLPIAQASPHQARKTLTVIFTDVTGSTALGERLDNETLGQVMNRYFAETRAVIERHGGTVDKFIGDAVLGVFGIPQVQENDALRAVSAAAEMGDALTRLNGELDRKWGIRIAIRTGVNTGEALVTALPLQSMVLGDVANVAARLEQAAEPDEILIGEVTYRLVKDAVRVEAIPPLQAKGKAKPVSAYRLVGMMPHAAQPRPTSALVGRREELSLLHALYRQTVRDRTARVVTVVGAAGVGKSRLVGEFVAAVEVESQVLQGRCLPYGEGITFWPVVEIVRRAAGITDEQSPSEARASISRVLREEPSSGSIADGVAEILGLSGSKAASAEIFWAVRRFLEALGRKQPLIVVFDDVQFGERTFHDLIGYMLDRSSEVPLLIICQARPELLEDRPAWTGGQPESSLLSLQSLTETETITLVHGLLDGSVGDAIGSHVATLTGGNPLFVEQILSMLAEERLLHQDNGRWMLAADPSAIVIPPTIRALLDTRLDRLDSLERFILEAASVVGQVFSLAAIRELSPAADGELEKRLSELVRRELIQPDPAVSARDTFRFRHLLIRDAAYQATTKSTRADLHERFARWLDRERGDRGLEYEEVIGYHLEQSYRIRCELGPPDEQARALAVQGSKRLASGGQRAYVRGDGPAAVNLLTRSLALMDLRDPDRLDLLRDLYDATLDTGEYITRGLPALGEFISVAEQSPQPVARARGAMARLLVSRFLDPAGLEQAFSDADEAIRVLGEHDDQRHLVEAWSVWGAVQWSRGQARAADDAFGRAWANARMAGAGEERTAMEALYFLTYAVVQGPRPAPDGISRLQEVLETTRGNRKMEAMFLVQQGILEAQLGRFDTARAHVQAGREIFMDLVMSRAQSAVAGASGTVELLAGELGAAERSLRAGYEYLLQTGDSIGIAFLAGPLAEVLYRQGRYDEAWQLTEPCMQSPWQESQIRWRAVQAKVLARHGELGPAAQLAQEAVQLAEATDMLNDRAGSLLDLAEVLDIGGRRREAVRAIEAAVDLFERKGNVVSAERARASLTLLNQRG
jgi:class 3 adenylate cyclase/DNA-binding IscR family transcriptional regulator